MRTRRRPKKRGIMKTRLTVIGFGIVSFLCNPTLAQDPRNVRRSLVVNEIMLYPKGNSCPWIELLNPTDQPIALDEFAVSLDSRDYSHLPRPPAAELMPGRVQLVVIRTPGCDVGLHRTWMSVPDRVLTGWRTGGAISLRRQTGDHRPLNEWSLVDYVAWGAPPGTNPVDQRELWPPMAFVPLQESVGYVPRGVAIQSDESIGLYPRRRTFGPREWVVYDERETTPGWENRVPAPKAFTVAPGATVGSRSVAITWNRESGDESYRFELYRLPNLTDPIIEAICDMAAVRIGGSLPDAEYLYTVVAMSQGVPSYESRARTLFAVDTPCDWPLPPHPSPENPSRNLAYWLLGPSCPDTPGCGLLPSIRFKFQRKDSWLRCTKCEISAKPGCPYNGIHPYCFNVVFTENRPTIHLCAGGSISPTCHRTAINRSLMDPDRAFAAIAAGSTATLSAAFASPAVESCNHGNDYCAFAALSMAASVYGKCLSQDWIANRLCDIDGDSMCHNLNHNKGVFPGETTKLFAWTMGIPEGAITSDPHNSRWGIVSAPLRQEPLAAFFNQQFPPVLKFDVLKYWIDSNRAIMGLQGGHYHAVAGYCEEPAPDIEGFATRKWLYIFDSLDGPKAQPFHDWLKLTATAPSNPQAVTTHKGVWVGPPGPWSGVREDDRKIWKDTDGNGLSDFDEARH